MRWVVPTVCFGALAAQSALAAPIPVKISFIEALAPRDTTSSERFQKDFDIAISLAKTSLAPRLAACGYSIDAKTSFYDASDPLQAKEKAEEATQQGSWLIVGPRRSNHYLILAKGSTDTPSVSLMASSSEVGELGKAHVSLSPLNGDMARVAAREALSGARDIKNLSFVSIVSSDCITCRDFADQFEQEAKRIGLKRLERLDVTGDFPDAAPILASLKDKKPGFILLPNYSNASSHLMAALQPVMPGGFFVGGDGWGDSRFGFVQSGRNLEQVRGFTVRGFPPFEQGLREFSLGRKLLASKDLESLPRSGPGLAILRIMQSTADLLCSRRPKSNPEFRSAFAKVGKQRFSAPWGVSVYDLDRGQIRFRATKRGN